MYTLRYYCQGSGSKEIMDILQQIKAKQQIPYEIMDLSTNGKYDQQKEKTTYEKDFKPQAKALKKATGVSITKLRSAKHRNYYVSEPGTIAIVKDSQTIWWTYTETTIKKFLQNLLLNGKLPI
jgi:hypothetical protein